MAQETIFICQSYIEDKSLPTVGWAYCTMLHGVAFKLEQPLFIRFQAYIIP